MAGLSGPQPSFPAERQARAAASAPGLLWRTSEERVNNNEGRLLLLGYSADLPECVYWGTSSEDVNLLVTRRPHVLEVLFDFGALLLQGKVNDRALLCEPA